MQEVVDLVQPYVRQVVVVGPIVEHAQAPPRLLVEDPSQTAVPLDSERIVQHRRATETEMSTKAAQLGVLYFSLFETICPGESCRLLADDGAPLQFDYAHLTASGSLTIARHWYASESRF